MFAVAPVAPKTVAAFVAALPWREGQIVHTPSAAVVPAVWTLFAAHPPRAVQDVDDVHVFAAAQEVVAVPKPAAARTWPVGHAVQRPVEPSKAEEAAVDW
jgi:hypothetical protein